MDERLYVFGTGNAAVTKLYNTCFALRFGDEYFMVDAGGGNGILRILEEMNVPIANIHHIFVTHEHTDHILGIVWMVRMIATKIKRGGYEGDAYLYCHPALVETITTLCRLTIQGKFFKMIGDRIHLVPVDDGETRDILGHSVTFFDIRSTKATQFGFAAVLNAGKKLAFIGDEPYSSACRPYVEGGFWLLSEAFCLYEEREKWKPYEKHHSTVREACELAESMSIPNLVLWHTEDSDIGRRQMRYLAEGRRYYHGNLFVPEDRTVIPL